MKQELHNTTGNDLFWIAYQGIVFWQSVLPNNNFLTYDDSYTLETFETEEESDDRFDILTS